MFEGEGAWCFDCPYSAISRNFCLQLSATFFSITFMKYYADLHIHSYFSRATSKQLNLEHLHKWAQLKGVAVVGTGDFVHPGWLDELKEKLEPAEEGFFKLKPEYAALTQPDVPAACEAPVRFMLTAEISNIYKKFDRVRKIHNVVIVPNFAAAERLQARLETIGNIRSDGRPILGLDSRDLLEITLETDPLAFLIPAHIWTPWFSALGSNSGFDSIEACFGDLTSHIFALETGLSSDPPMNWRLSQLDPYVLVSNSDAHSPQKLAREATIFDTEFDYPSLYRALSDPEDPGLLGTIEFFPEEGKYHYDGHRKCGTRMHPRETIANQGLCPKCGKPVTVGVMARVEELADRPEGEKPPRWKPYYSLIPLPEIIAEARNTGVNSKGVQQLFRHLLTKLGNELFILQDAPLEDIERAAGSLIAEGIRRMRNGEIHIAAGYDGEYGVIRIFDEHERKSIQKQTTFFPEPKPEEAAEKTGALAEKDRPSAESNIEQTGAEKKPVSSPEEVHDKSESYKPIRHPLNGMDDQLGTRLPEDLNAAQWRAVTHTGGHLLIVAGPGTGKTHTLVHRIAHFTQCFASPEEILAITFTNKAAEEMQERLHQRLGNVAAQMTIGTFHSFCLQILRRHAALLDLPRDFQVASLEDQEAIIKEVFPETGAAERKQLLDTISAWKSRGQFASAPAEVQQYDAALRERRLLDFDDLLLECLRLLEREEDLRERICQTYRFIFVDEYQDINSAQHALLKWLVSDGAQITAIGDPNQAIYGFRGSRVEYFLQFEQDFPGATILYLSDNYRSAVNLLRASTQVISKRSLSGVPPLTPRMLLDGRLVVHEAPSEKAEAEFVVHQIEKMVGGTSMFSQDSGRVASGTEAERTFADIAVLYRLNALRPVLEDALARMGIPYQVSGDRPLIGQPAVREIIAALRLAAERPVPLRDFWRMLELAGEGIGPKTLEKLQSWLPQTKKELNFNDAVSILEKLINAGSGSGQAGESVIRGLTELKWKLGQSGLTAALQHLLLVPGWQKALTADEKRHRSWQRLVQLSQFHHGFEGFLDHIALQREFDAYEARAERISLMTLHAAKGLEFPVVFIIGCEDGIIPCTLERPDSDPAEERRLFYVGMTRAKEQLYLVRSRKRRLYGTLRELKASPYLTDIEEQLKQYEKAARRRRQKTANPNRQLELFG